MPPQPKIIAIVDDDPSMLRAAGNLLRAKGLTVRPFVSAETFLADSTALQIDYLLLDIKLSGMSGIELRRHLTACGVEIPVIFMTGNDDEELHTQAHEAGCITCLRKPFRIRDLLAAIDKA